jgi:UDP-N-acetylmuramyl tripeptide synthase
MNKLKLKHLESILGITFPNDIEITHATCSTRKVRKNSIFFGLQGTKVHGSKFIEDALELGASVAVHDDPNYKINNKDIENKIFYIEDIDKPWREAEEHEKNCVFINELTEGDELVFISNKLLVFLCAFHSSCRFISRSLETGHYALPSFNGFTGTNGKTSSAFMAHQLKNSFYSDGIRFQSIYIGTLGFQYYEQNDKYYENNGMRATNFDTSISGNTTPDIFEVFEILRKISDNTLNNNTSESELEFYKEASDDDYTCPFYEIPKTTINIEISSHALDQGRLKYLPFSKVALMNIGSDHIDYHKTINEYEKSKLRIFDLVHKNGKKYIGINAIKRESKVFKEYLAHHEMPITIGFEDKSADIYCEISKPIKSNKENTFKITRNIPWDDADIYINSHSLEMKYACKIFPEFNIHNLVFSIVMTSKPFMFPNAEYFYEPEVGREEAIEIDYEIDEDIKDEDINSYPVKLNKRVKLPPGRTQIISDIPANVIIDYAHNTEGFDFFLSSIKDSYEKLVIIFGCGGDRDKDKRPKMLATAIEYGYKIIFTSDNSRNEKFIDIYNHASKGNDIKDVLMIEDRKKAIIQGTKLIKKNDCLVILGKGHEETQEISGKIMHFSDYGVIHEIYK